MGTPSARIRPKGDTTLVPFVGERPFDEFYRRELPGLVALARALCPPPLAEDVAQEAMLVALRRWSEISELNRPEAWVRRICANMSVSVFRRRMAEVRALGRTRPPEPSALGHGAHQEFWELVRRLPPRQAQAVALRYLFDLSVEDVASTLGVSQGSVKVHLSRARQTLARQLGAEGEERS